MRDAKIVVDDATITRTSSASQEISPLDPAFDCVDTVYGMGYRRTPKPNHNSEAARDAYGPHSSRCP
jgi:hypothetical protein